MASTKVRRAVIYARLSVTQEESVSIDRQVESCSKFAEAQGWNVIAVSVDDGISATHNKPEQRKGWQAVLNSEEQFDVVIVWKVDRLARRVLDFLHADEALQTRKAAVVSATEPIDMSTAQGRAFATMLAVFAELEAHAISARVKGARDFLIRNGRVVGGTVPYGYRSIKNPDGAGFVLDQDPATIKHVRAMAERALAGHSIYSIKRWLDEAGAPLPTTSQKNRKYAEWRYSTVERILRSPILAGMTAFNPGNRTKVRGDDVLRDQHGLPVVDESLAVITTEERRQLLALLDDRDSPQAQPRAARGTTPALLSGMVRCGHCERVMHRGTNAGRPVMSCPGCYQQVVLGQLTELISTRLVAERGRFYSYEEIDVTVDQRHDVADIQEAMHEITAKMTEDAADMVALTNQLEALKALRADALRAAPAKRYRAKLDTVRQAWKFAQDDAERRVMLMSQVDVITVRKGKTGRFLDPERVEISWRDNPQFTQLPEVDHSRWYPKLERSSRRTSHSRGSVGAEPDGACRDSESIDEARPYEHVDD